MQVLDYYIGSAGIEFGRSTAMKWAEEIATFEYRVKLHPTSYTPESLLADRAVVYRRCHVMKRRFKVIYYYDEKEDVVHLIDIWDTRMSPSALIRRIK